MFWNQCQDNPEKTFETIIILKLNFWDMKNLMTIISLLSIMLAGCGQRTDIADGISYAVVEPRIVTEPTKWDTDDPAIWINPIDPSKSLIIGTDKNQDGALYVYDLEGRIVNVVDGLKRPNNVDVAYGFPIGGEKVDIAVTTERLEQRLRVFRLPDMEPLDAGDLIVFDGDEERAPMGIALYKRPADNAFFVIVSGKSGPAEGYLGQYLLEAGERNNVKITPVREFGKYSGKKEIEAVAVDAELGYVYYSDEMFGVRKYHADPDVPDAGMELALFATEGFTQDQEGISIYKVDDSTGYIIVSDQEVDQFWIFPREGSENDPHDHRPVKIIKASTISSDGNEVTSRYLSPEFPNGLFVAMSEGKVFHYYAWEDIAGDDLRIRK